MTRDGILQLKPVITGIIQYVLINKTKDEQYFKA